MKHRPSLRHGLPYGWWRLTPQHRRRARDATLLVGSLAALVVVPALVIATLLDPYV